MITAEQRTRLRSLAREAIRTSLRMTSMAKQIGEGCASSNLLDGVRKRAVEAHHELFDQIDAQTILDLLGNEP